MLFWQESIDYTPENVHGSPLESGQTLLPQNLDKGFIFRIKKCHVRSYLIIFQANFNILNWPFNWKVTKLFSQVNISDTKWTPRYSYYWQIEPKSWRLIAFIDNDSFGKFLDSGKFLTLEFFPKCFFKLKNWPILQKTSN